MTEAQNIAAALQKDGQAMTLTRSTAGAYDPITGTMGATVTQTWTVYGRDNPIGSNTTMINGTLVLTGDRLLLVSADKVIAIPGDSIAFDSETWTVLSRSKIKGEGSEVVLQKLHVRS